MIVLLGLEFEGNSVSRLEETEVNCSYIRPRILMKLGVEVAREGSKTLMYGRHGQNTINFTKIRAHQNTLP